MLNIINILNQASSNCLVLLDEIGGGTDPLEGASLAKAIIDELKNKGVYLLCSTHYLELKTYGVENKDIEVASVAFDSVTLKPLYYLNIGIVGSSNAIKIASRLGLSDKIINSASDYLSQNTTDISKLYNTLNDEKIQNINLSKELSTTIKEYENLKINLEKERLSFELSKQATINKEIEKAKKEFKNLKAQVLNIIEELKTQGLKSSSVYAYKQRLGDLDPNLNSDYAYSFKLGDSVYISSVDDYGTITKVWENEALDKTKYDVDLRGINLNFRWDELSIASKDKLKRPTTLKKTSTTNLDNEVLLNIASTSAQSSVLDLRGKRYAEVDSLIDYKIENAILSGLNFIKIIHGFGSGVVKKRVMEYIASSKIIKSSKSGSSSDGGSGVTYIYF
jgi:DNA mismatch repair protein MutS2